MSHRYEFLDGTVRWSAVDVGAWIPDPTNVGLTLLQAIEIAEVAEELQQAAHCGDAEEIRECSQGDCWVSHLEDAMRRVGDVHQ